MDFLVALVILSLAILIHEIGHAIACKQTGIPLETVAIGFGKKTWWHIKVPFRFFGPDAYFRVFPLFLGGYIKVVPGTLLGQSYFIRSYINGAGIIANLIVGILAMGAHRCFFSESLPPELYPVFIGLSALLYALRKPISAYVFPFATFPVLALIVVMVLQAPMELHGTISPLTLMVQESSVQRYPLLFGAMNIGLGGANLIPLSVTDGGQTLGLLIQRYTPRLEGVYNIIGIVVLGLLILWGVVADVINWIF